MLTGGLILAFALASTPAPGAAAQTTIALVDNADGTKTLRYAEQRHKPNVVTVKLNGGTGNFEIEDQGITAIADGGGCSVSGNQAQCPAADVSRISVSTGSGVDSVELASDIATPAVIDGGPGNDTTNPRRPERKGLVGGSGDDILMGGDGNDTLNGGPGDDVLMGGPAKDSLDGGLGDDVLQGGPGTDTYPGLQNNGSDTVDYSDKTAPVTVTLDDAGAAGGAGANDGEAGEKENVGIGVVGGFIENIRGGAGDDKLTGSRTPNVIDGGPGGDEVKGGLGFDTVDYSGATSDLSVTVGNGAADDGQNNGAEGDNVADDVERVLGGSHNDTLTGSEKANLVGAEGANVLVGGDGNDTLSGNPGPDPDGADAFEGGGGIDTVTYAARTAAVRGTIDGAANDGAAGEGDSIGGDVENVVGGAGDDVLAGDGDPNGVLGGPGNDILHGGQGADALLGGPGNDTIDGGGGPDLVQGGSGDDTLRGGGGNDRLDGGPNEDVLDGGGGNDALNGGSGGDRADYSASTVALSVSADGAAGDGRAGESDNVAADVESIDGGTDNDTLTGSPGNGTLNGGPGDDSLDGGGGSDNLSGGPGSDVANYASRAVGVNVNLDVPGGDGQAGENDNVAADVERVRGGSGPDTLTGDGGSNILLGGPGNDTIDGGGGPDLVQGGSGDDTLRGGGGTDVVNGDGGNDTLRGGPGDDTLRGGAGNDSLDGGTGADAMNGGPGTDTADYRSRGADVKVSTDGVPGDGRAGENDNVRTDVESVSTGSGNDDIDTNDGARGRVSCGAGIDEAAVDNLDDVDRRSCERVEVTSVLPTVEIRTGSARIRGKTVAVILRCESDFPDCEGTLSLRTIGRVRTASAAKRRKRRTRTRRRKLTLGRKSYSIAAGKTKKVKVRIRKRARRAIRRARRVKVRATATPSTVTIWGNPVKPKRVRKIIRVKAPKKKRSRSRR